MEQKSAPVVPPLIKQLVDDTLKNGFVVIIGTEPLPRVPTFTRASDDHKQPVPVRAAQVRARVLKIAEVLLEDTDDHFRFLLIDNLLTACLRDMLLRAKTGDERVTELLIKAATEIVEEFQGSEGAFKTALRGCAESRIRFPVLVGLSKESQGAANGFLTDLNLGEKPAVKLERSRKSKTPDIATSNTTAGLVYSLIEYFNSIKAMKVIAGQAKLDEELKKSQLDRQLYDAILKLKPLSSANWPSWHTVAVRFLKRRYGTLEDACGGSNPSSQLRAAIEAIAGRIRDK